MKNFEQALIDIRPKVIFNEIHSNPIQQFQDNTLRPILKLQHRKIISIYNNYLETHKINLKHCTAIEINNKIENSIQQNIALNSLLKGLIIALFTSDELLFWLSNKVEINKRIQQLIIKRIQNSFVE